MKFIESFFILTSLILFPQLALAQSNINQNFELFAAPLFGAVRGSEIVTIESDEIINDNFVKLAEKIIIDGDVAGDVIVGAGELIINGSVSGDVIAVAEKITINGPVAGNIRVAALEINLNNSVGKNVNIAATKATVQEDASIGWTLSFAVEELNVNGPVSGSIYGYGHNITLNSTVDNNVTLILDQTGLATLASKAVINGNFSYRSDNNAAIKDGATVIGDTVHKLIPDTIIKAREFLSFSWFFGKIIGFFSLLLVGTLLISLFDQRSKEVLAEFWPNPYQKILWGLLLLILLPIAIIIISVTIIGIPLALILVGVFVFLAYISSIYVGLFLGDKILNYKKEKSAPMIWTMILGVFLYSVLINIPYIGWVISLLGMVWFLGVVLKIIFRSRIKNKEVKNEQTKPKSI